MWSTVAREDMSKRVYIVDDDDAVRSALSLLIRAYGWEAQAHASAESFLEDDVVAEESCLLLDLDMPGMNGAELCEHLKGARSAIPVLVVTAHQDDPLAARALAAGAQAIIPKPVDDEALVGMVRQCLDEAC